jgi:uncharacterized protein with PIN domain
MSEEPVEQLKEVFIRYDLKRNLNPFTRCMICNGEVVCVRKEEIESTLQPRTRSYYNEFRKCYNCGKIYWEGSHYEKMKSFIVNNVLNSV